MRGWQPCLHCAELYRVSQRFGRVLKGASREVQTDLVEIVLDSQLPESDPLATSARAVRDALTYEDEVLKALGRVGFQLQEREVGFPVGMGLMDFDAFGEFEGVGVLVEIKFASGLRPALRRATVTELLELAPSLGSEITTPVLLVASGSPTPEAAFLFGRARAKALLAMAMWRSSNDDPELVFALNQLREEAGGPGGKV